ncbi:FxsB family cyclophane-forming radical SAM/SPASM peptide maturase [Catenulispora rubra]|uniref:FxsB family cyclophane-forming radical SAM/SPASM peptide maturase n=1 Tax=Catenulispora rubra TaxID=280293 RepID=UPI002B271A45|nr:FxsB family cyclophane-forming radical SAM/SPASM peptide maturase [Catenulispora rubra]
MKIQSRCNLACAYCYMYEHADQSWRTRPVAMSDEIVASLAARIGEHAATHRLPAVGVVFHGGEPLLAGGPRIRWIAERIRAALAPATRLELHLQTNGVLLAAAHGEELCQTLLETGIKVGISLDGDRDANDRHRRHHNGASSFQEVVSAVLRLGSPRYRRAFSGLLCTIDPKNDPVESYQALSGLDPPRIDYLLPHANWDVPPARPAGTGTTPYADWLIAVHRRWSADGQRLPIRVFDSIRSALVGGESLKEALGTEPCDLAVVETDGSIELADSLKTAYDGAPRTGFHILKHSFDEAAAHPGFTLREAGAAGLCQTCRQCPVVDVCGGGLYAHRYSKGNSFDNPSVHCADLLKIITYMKETPSSDSGRTGTVAAHQMSGDCFDGLAAGFGDVVAVRQLAAAQQSINRGLLDRVLTASCERGEYSRQPWQAFDALQRDDPDAYRKTLLNPFLRVWASRYLDATLGPADQEYLSLSISDHPHRPQLTADGLTVTLDNVDPCLDCYGKPLIDHLDPAAVAAWQHMFAEAWRLIVTEYFDYAPAIGAGLSTIVPLMPQPGVQTSATARQAFGAIAIALPDTADDLALLIIHEFQHVKAGALMDMFDLYDPTSPLRFSVPWRRDERPPEAALQGLYAHAAVADVWRTRWLRASNTESERSRSGMRYATWHRAVAQVADALQASGVLTRLGERLVTGLVERANQ